MRLCLLRSPLPFVLSTILVACGASATNEGEESSSDDWRRRHRDAGADVTTPPPPPTSTSTSTSDAGAPPPPPDAAAPVTTVTHGSQVGASNTGPRTALTKATGDVTLSTDGAVYENVDLTGSITVTATNVTIRNCKVHMSGGYFTIRGQGKNLLVENVEVYSDTPSSAYTGIVGDSMTVRAANIHGFENGMAVGSNVVVEASWIHDLAGVATGHRDGIEWGGGGDNSVVRRNRFEVAADDTACLNVTPYGGGTAKSVRVEDNVFAGGGYSLYVRGDGGGTVSGVTVTGNVWKRGSYAYGPASIVKATNLTASGNTYDDGAALGL